MKKLNNKGFTLIELLAVIVILAVVMAIASTSVISAMNNSRKSSLQDSAKSVQQAFQTKYSESIVTNSATAIYGDVIGLYHTGSSSNPNPETRVNGYDFTAAKKDAPRYYFLSAGLSNELNLSTSTYNLRPNDICSKCTTGTVSINFVGNLSGWYLVEPRGFDDGATSFVAFDSQTIIACLVAKPSGNMYVSAAASTKSPVVFGKKIPLSQNNKTDGSETDKFMWACSDGTHSWT